MAWMFWKSWLLGLLLAAPNCVFQRDAKWNGNGRADGPAWETKTPFCCCCYCGWLWLKGESDFPMAPPSWFGLIRFWLSIDYFILDRLLRCLVSFGTTTVNGDWSLNDSDTTHLPLLGGHTRALHKTPTPNLRPINHCAAVQSKVQIHISNAKFASGLTLECLIDIGISVLGFSSTVIKSKINNFKRAPLGYARFLVVHEK